MSVGQGLGALTCSWQPSKQEAGAHDVDAKDLNRELFGKLLQALMLSAVARVVRKGLHWWLSFGNQHFPLIIVRMRHNVATLILLSQSHESAYSVHPK